MKILMDVLAPICCIRGVLPGPIEDTCTATYAASSSVTSGEQSPAPLKLQNALSHPRYAGVTSGEHPPAQLKLREETETSPDGKSHPGSDPRPH